MAKFCGEFTSSYLLLAGEAFRLSFQFLPRDALDLDLPKFRGEFAPLSYRRLPYAESESNGPLRPEKLDHFLRSHAPIIGIPIDIVNRQPDSISGHHLAVAKDPKKEPGLETLAGRVKYLRDLNEGAAKKMNQTAFAKKARISQATLSDIETGEIKEPSGRVLADIAAVRGVRLEWLLSREDPMYPTGEAGPNDPQLSPEEDDAIQGELLRVWEHLPAQSKRRLLHEAKVAIKAQLDAATKRQQALNQAWGFTGEADDRRVRQALAKKPEKVRK